MEEIKEINKIIEKISTKFYDELKDYGYIKGGHNGPYKDEETPVRNTAHWVIIFKYLYNLKNEKKYYDAACKAADFLLSKEARPNMKTFFCRKNPNKDYVNGLIGQAWAIESLVEAYRLSNRKRYIQEAENVFLMHKFNKKLGLWNTCDLKGNPKKIDKTFNHQLWFAAAGVMLYSETKNSRIEEQIEKFFIEIDKNLAIHNNGLVIHKLDRSINIKDYIKDYIRNARAYYNKLLIGKDMLYKENGYHLFNVYAFALIYFNDFKSCFFDSDKFENMLNYSFTEELYKKLLMNDIQKDITNKAMPIMNTEIKVNRYGYPYNAPGFELPFIYKVFRKKIKINKNFVHDLINNQIELTYNGNEKVFSKNTEDKITLTSRIYELTRYLG